MVVAECVTVDCGESAAEVGIGIGKIPVHSAFVSSVGKCATALIGIKMS